MKKVFLLLATALMGVATFAGNSWEQEGNVISIGWNEYGKGNNEDAYGGKSVQWQAGNAEILPAVVSDQADNDAWIPAVGEKFMITLEGTANFNGVVQVFIVDEREDANYWTDLAGTCGEFEVKAGKPFSSTTVLEIKTIQTICEGLGNAASKKGETIDLTLPSLIFGIFGSLEKDGALATVPTDAEGNTFKTNQDCIFEVTTFEVLYSEALDVPNPISLTYKGKADEGDGFKYQYDAASGIASVSKDGFVNVEFEGTAMQDVETLMYSLADVCAKASYWTQMTEMVSVKANIKENDKVSLKFSIPVNRDVVAADGANVYNNVLLAQSVKQSMAAVFKDASIKSDFSATAKYDAPKLAIEAIAAEEAIVNGVIYSSSIVVYNVAGQVVATASEEFAINSLSAGVYVAKTAEGAFSFVVK